ncbi:MAG TPA: type III-B CRISPR-associated protein Cas10/Cmr2 [Methanothrix soehngenii]|uniref:type III-B CRISPR-associated protein Cas10/Cmr2 n=1 Tax=Methanothrix soehngenii TaxID=2223 RepID=UPI002C007AB5|nr:type III-B CRISPR-associated protein Cas10/Cmr2 [Methanothrix soehngenii]HOI20036.1 type III-B CRISPR-associated protein Cas10/Cmr2 [Methanothrix soehngenii]
MTGHLFVISIGSVQDFIAAARRTRDLWFGSHLLSEISKAAAKAIAEEGGELIFPALKKGDSDLEPSNEIDAFNVANIIVAELPGSITDPSYINKKARIAAKKTWMHYAIEARELAGNAIVSDIWEEQISDVDELAFDIMPIYAAWVPLGSSYREDRKRLMRLLSGRKSIRDFGYVRGRKKVPKSSLDGARETVLTADKKVRKTLALRLRLGNGEQLCAVGLTKRLGGGKVPFPSVVRVAVDPWIRGVIRSSKDGNKEALGDLAEIADICQKENNFSSGVGKHYQKYKKDFGFDGQIFYPSRLSQLLRPNPASDSCDDNLSAEDLQKLMKIKEKVDHLQNKETCCLGLGEPDPYLAILIADGDHMGKAISEIKTPEDHREFSRNLSAFAKEARDIVESNNGVLVYSGGDDVIAILPVDKCLSAARELHERFGKLKLIKDDQGNLKGGLTISVGIAIAHAFEPLEDLIEQGRNAEKAAKESAMSEQDDRNGLAVHLYKRGGGDPICLREQWTDDDRSLDKRLYKWAKMHNTNELPDKAAYEMRELAEVYRNWKGTPKEDLSNLIKADAKRMLKRKRPGCGENLKVLEKDIDSMLLGLSTYQKVRHLANELLLARKLSEVMRMADGIVLRPEAKP